MIGGFLLLLFVLPQNIVHEKGSLEDRTLEKGSGVPKATAYFGLVGDGHVRRLFQYFVQRNWK